MSDPEVEALAAGQDNALEVYQAAAAELERTRRSSTTRLLSRLRLSVVQAPPATFSHAVADHYLALKKPGQL